jgi:hypothetical protein
MIGNTRMWLAIAEKHGLFAEVVVCGTEYCKARAVSIGERDIERRVDAIRSASTQPVRWPSSHFEGLIV